MKPWIKSCLLAALLVSNFFTHAQNFEQGSGIAGCQAGSGVCNGWQWQGQQQPSAPPRPVERWADRWGAIATDSNKGVVGSASGEISKSFAENSAMIDCKSKGGSNCTLQASYVNACGVMILGDEVFNVNWGPDEDDAARKGLDMCNKESLNCRIYYATCSPPVRIQ